MNTKKNMAARSMEIAGKVVPWSDKGFLPTSDMFMNAPIDFLEDRD